MAFGLNPHFTQYLDLGDLPAEHFIAIGITTAKQLGWDIQYISKSGFVALTPYSFAVIRARVEIIVKDSAATVKSECLGTQMYDWGKNKKFVEEFNAHFATIQENTSEGELHNMLADLMPIFTSNERDALDNSNHQSGIKSFFSIFIPVKGFFITPIIINANILVFALMLISGVSVLEPNGEQLIVWGANLRPLVQEGQLWRLFTNTFIHIGILHLLFNMYALLYIGILLEPYLGRARFATAYLITGLAASVASVYWHPLTISAGASGAIFGMYGVFLAMLTTNFIDKTVRKALLTSIIVFVVYNLVNGLKAGIDNAAHIGGLLSGLVIGYSYYPSFNKPAHIRIKYLTIAASGFLILFSSFVILKNIPDDINQHDKAMIRFAKNEEQAVSIFQMKNVRSRAVILDSLHDKIYVWKNNISLLDSLKRLNLPQEILDRDRKLKTYCDLRIDQYQLIYKSVDEQSRQYDDSIKNCTEKIKTIINDLKGIKE